MITEGAALDIIGFAAALLLELPVLAILWFGSSRLVLLLPVSWAFRTESGQRVFNIVGGLALVGWFFGLGHGCVIGLSQMVGIFSSLPGLTVAGWLGLGTPVHSHFVTYLSMPLATFLLVFNVGVVLLGSITYERLKWRRVGPSAEE